MSASTKGHPVKLWRIPFAHAEKATKPAKVIIDKEMCPRFAIEVYKYVDVPS
jgi:hypothetical protein